MAAERTRQHFSSLVEQILVVCEDESVVHAIRSTLGPYGYAVKSAASSAEALEAVRAEPFVLAFVDIQLPDRSGLELAREFKSRLSSPEIVFITERGRLEDAVEAIRLGAYDFLPRPFGPDDLTMAIGRLRERARLEDLAFKAQLQYDHLVQNIPLVIFTMNPSLGLDFVNKAVYDMLGYTPEESVTREGWFTSVLHPEDRERVLRLMGDGADCGESFSAQCRMVHKKGRVVHVMIKSMPCFSFSRGEPSHRFEGVIMDITDRVLLEKALVQDEKLKTLGAISAEMAHEIRNPLVSIGGFARRLEKKGHTGPELEIILRETARLESLLNRIRDYMRPLRIQRQGCSVNRILAECVNLVYPEMTERNVTVDLDLDEEMDDVLADPDILAQVFFNLMVHGLHTMPADEVLHVVSRDSGTHVEVEFRHVVAEGVVLDPERMFLPFEEGGAHVGLPLSYRLIKNMHGLLAYAEDQGRAVLTVTLPKDTGAGEHLISELDPTLARIPDTEDSRVSLAMQPDFQVQLEREFHRAKRVVAPLSVLIVDVDHFRPFSSIYGRKSVYAALDRIGEALGRTMKLPGDFLETFAPQQFAVVLPDTNELGALIVAEDMREAVHALAIPNKGSRVDPFLTVSVGVASTVPSVDATPEDLVAEASKALIRAKRKGRNRVAARGLIS